MSTQLPFTITAGQFWEKGGHVYHVPHVEKDHGHHRWQVIRCTNTSDGWCWVFPRSKEDEPIWSLADFQDARLLQ